MAGKSRSAIVNAIITELKKIDGSGDYSVDLANNVTNKLVFWDEVNDFPYVSVVAGSENREYLPGGFKWGYLGITIRIYVYGEEPLDELEKVLYDVETQLDKDQTLTYDTGKSTEQISLLSISTDEGLLAPYGVGEITLEIRYQV
jgi:hypothetical protein